MTGIVCRIGFSYLALLYMQLPIVVFGQSPFNYGQNKNVYFISTELRTQWDIKSILKIDQLPDNQRGGMGENWDVTEIDFENNSITENWYPVYRDTNYRFQFNEMTEKMDYLNGTSYSFSDGQLISYGGEGYGSFDWKDISRQGDSVSIVITSCTGHCGDQPDKLSKNVFHPDGDLLFVVNYASENPDYPVDTLFYSYNKNGLLTNDGRNDSILTPLQLFDYELTAAMTFHQCYIDKIPFEKYLYQKTGGLPHLILIEIYRYGVFSFILNSKDKKYYPGRTIMLER